MNSRFWPPRFGLRTLFVILSLPALIFLADVLLGRIVWWYVNTPHQFESSDDWPFEIQKLVKACEMDATRDIDVHELGGFIDESYKWGCNLHPKDLRIAIDTLDISAIDAPTTPFPKWFWKQQPAWWSPPSKLKGRFFSSDYFSFSERGPDGEHFFAAYDSNAHRLYIFQKSNF